MADSTECRSCRSKQLVEVFSLGEMPLANDFLREEDLSKPEEMFPLDLFFCKTCTLVQLAKNVAPEILFSHYAYFSSFSDTMLAHARDCVYELIETRRLSAESLVVEIASNDGYLLSNYLQHGIPVLGIEPAANVASVAVSRGIETMTEFFGVELAKELRSAGKIANVIHAHNVLAHVPDINGFVEGISILLADDGVAIIEVPYLQELIDKVEFDTIYHEHIFYFSLQSLKSLFDRHGLRVCDVRRLHIHGGSLRLCIAKDSAIFESVDNLLAEEQATGLNQPLALAKLQSVVQNLKRRLVLELTALKREGKRIAAYGAAAKGSVLLNYFGIDTKLLEFVVDRNTHKQGLFVPGPHIPILPVEALLEQQIDYVLVLAWNFAEEIISQQNKFLEGGGAFIIPLPEFRIVSA